MPDSGRGAAKRTLARRLRELRTTHWPDVVVTQAGLAAALSDQSRVTGPSISSWEKDDEPVAPPADRLSAYATFFATRRSMTQGRPRLLDVDEMTPEEAAAREQLESELLTLRDAAVAQGTVESGDEPDPWRFGDREPVTIICGEVSKEQRDLQRKARPEHPTLAYGEMYSYADIDTLYELHGRLRASNPTSPVKTVRWKDVGSEDLLAHVLIVGRGDRGPMWRHVERRARLPVRYMGLDDAGLAEQYIEVEDGHRYAATLDDDGHLQADVGLFYRGPNPFDRQRTLTFCHGMFASGTLSVMRSLTDDLMAPRNIEYLDVDRANRHGCLVLLRIEVYEGESLIPDWGEAGLFEWRGDS